MKRILTIAVIAFLVIFGYSKYREIQRFKAPSQYDYEISEEIDVNYHDPATLSTYYKKANEIGSFARSVWSSERVDVLYPNKQDQMELLMAKEYQDLIAEVQQLEGSLKQSAQLKSQGFDNLDIRRMEVNGMGAQQYQYEQSIGNAEVELNIGDNGQLVYMVQRYLGNLGYEIILDGIYKEQTSEAVVKFQEKQGLLPSGIVDAITLRRLYRAQP